MSSFEIMHVFRPAFIGLGTVALLSSAACSGEAPAAQAESSDTATSEAVRSAIEKLQGTYEGSWTMFGVDEQGNTKTITSWTDQVTASGSVIESDRVYTHPVNHMVLQGGATRDISWTEGFFLGTDGSIGERYFDMGDGQLVREHQIADRVFTYAQAADTNELASLGFVNATFGEHVTTKVVATLADGTDMERISRLTTVEWTDASGNARATQMVTMQGYHHHL